MKKNNTTKFVVVLVIFVVALIYTLPSTPLWESAFGSLSPEEQAGMPLEFFEYKEDNNSVLLTMSVNSSAEIFNRNQNPVRVEDFLDTVCETVRQKLIQVKYKVESDNVNLVDKKRTYKVSNSNGEKLTVDKLKADIDNLKLYAKYPLVIASFFPQRKITLGLDLKGGLDIVYRVEIDENTKDSRADAVRRSVEVIRSRIDKYGVAEPSIKAQEGNRIRVQLPGVTETNKIKSLIQNTAKLDFMLVLDQNFTPSELNSLEQCEKKVFPAKNDSLWYLLKEEPKDSKVKVSGDDLKFAKVAFDEFGKPIIHLEFNTEGSIKFRNLTAANIGRQLAIVLGGKVHSAPRIQTAISGGYAQITGGFSLDEAKELALTLRSGALPATLTELESRVIGPTLGQKSIQAGFAAGIVGFILVMIVMLLWYKTCGVIADLALVFNSLIVFAALVMFGGTMTLPGIAGFVLSVGMAVDANVIIFERIREEYHSGKTVRAAIASGFDRAFSCILDSNVTTILIVAILYYFTTGPIRGFATTLGIGLIANLYTAVVFSKLCLETWFEGHPERKLGL